MTLANVLAFRVLPVPSAVGLQGWQDLPIPAAVTPPSGMMTLTRDLAIRLAQIDILMAAVAPSPGVVVLMAFVLAPVVALAPFASGMAFRVPRIPPAVTLVPGVVDFAGGFALRFVEIETAMAALAQLAGLGQ